MSSRELAGRHHVDPATIVRTTQALGYGKFHDFAADLRGHFVQSLTPSGVTQAATRQNLRLRDRIRQTLLEDTELMHALQSSLSPDQVIAFARMVYKARRILVVGVDLAASLSWFLAYSLTVLGFDAAAPIGSAGNLFHHVRLLEKRDLIVAISFRKCLRETVETVRLGRARGVPTFGITDKIEGPLGRHCDRILRVSVESPSFAGSYVAAMAALNVMLVACASDTPRGPQAAMRTTREEYLSGARWCPEEAPRPGD
jgi:DNA-binding MurR/RpiR family transcriptional regulator